MRRSLRAPFRADSGSRLFPGNEPRRQNRRLLITFQPEGSGSEADGALPALRPPEIFFVYPCGRI